MHKRGNRAKPDSKVPPTNPKDFFLRAFFFGARPFGGGGWSALWIPPESVSKVASARSGFQGSDGLLKFIGHAWSWT